MYSKENVYTSIFGNPNFWAAILITVTAVLGISSLSSALPKIAEYFKVDDASVGLILFFFTLPGIVFSPILGFFSDKVGRKIILLIALFIFGLGALGFFVNDFKTLLFIRFIQGIGASTLLSLNVAILGDTFEGRNLKFALGINGVITSIALTVFPILGGILSDKDARSPFLLSTFSFLSLILIIFLLNENKQNTKNSDSQTSLKNAFKTNLIFVFLGTICTFIVLYGAYLNYFSFLTKYRFEMSGTLTGVFIGISSFISAIVSYKIERITEFFSDEIIYVIGFVFYAISMILFEISKNYAFLTLGAISFGAAQGINITLTPQLINKFTDERLRGFTMTVNGSMVNLGQTIGPLIFSYAYRFAKLNGVFILGFLVSLLGVLLTTKLTTSKTLSS
ncbi:major facilitator superfamily protein [Caldisericum exile AZM16c01]|uniref:Major facilitator superfamily protein n=1 Tax=Caldisericum exile (strain DSM 21853 / NBRC 104410 / AZM16c01) TaxID=511051 RepID=A0A7U6JGA9_CALEA|nr:major facilitator superfamily protein [Caldisericum exile AZM16c01]